MADDRYPERYGRNDDDDYDRRDRRRDDRYDEGESYDRRDRRRDDRYDDDDDYDRRDGRRGDVPNYLTPAILCTLFCCVPFGIAAIVYASQVNSKLAGGDYRGALESSRQAKMWCWISFALGLIALPIIIALELAAENNFQ